MKRRFFKTFLWLFLLTLGTHIWFAKYSDRGLTITLPAWIYSQDRDEYEPATYRFVISKHQVNPWGTLWRDTGGWTSAVSSEPQIDGETLQTLMARGRYAREEDSWPARKTTYFEGIAMFCVFVSWQDKDARLTILQGGPIRYFEHYGWAVSGIRFDMAEGGSMTIPPGGMVWFSPDTSVFKSQLNMFTK